MTDLPALTLADLSDDPLELVVRWLAEAEATGMVDPTAMTVATAGADGMPSARTVLLRRINAEGLRFYTNRESLKGRQLAENPRAELLLFWRELGRQIRVQGTVELTSDADSSAYFDSRHRGSRIGAWASRQGTILTDREQLLAAYSAVDAQYSGEDIPLPPYWGGYLVRPLAIEFWQAGEYRLHDRFAYVRDGSDSGWRVERLAP